MDVPDYLCARDMVCDRCMVFSDNKNTNMYKSIVI